MGSRIIEWCDRCGRADEDGFPLFPLKIECGDPQEEGWEHFKLDLCQVCWDDIREEFHTFLYEWLKIPQDQVFGSYDFYAKANVENALTAWREARAEMRDG